MTPDGQTRRLQVAAGLEQVDVRIRSACQAAGRARSEVSLIVVTKTWPASDVRLAALLGTTDVGEAREQEARAKHAACVDLGLRWHFIGQLQTNKARSVCSFVDVVHSVDRARLVTALSAGAVHHDRQVRCLVQVALAPGTGGGLARGGAPAAQVPALADLVAGAPGLVLAGVMAVAPRGVDPARSFAELARTAAAVQASHPQATDISAGMSGDLEAAVAAGATHLRVGTSVFGSRPPLR